MKSSPMLKNSINKFAHRFKEKFMTKRIFLLLLTAVFGLQLAAAPIKWVGMKKSENNGIILLNDNRTDAGLYLMTAQVMPIEKDKDFVLSVQVKTAAGSKNRPAVFIRVLDKNKKKLPGFTAIRQGGVDAEGFATYICKIASGKWAKEAVGFQIILQPAAGKVESTGTAAFRKLEFNFLGNTTETVAANTKIKWLGMKKSENNGVILLNDDRTDAGLYLMTAQVIPIEKDKDFVLSVQVKTASGSKNRPAVFIRVLDKNKKKLPGFAAIKQGGVDADGFTTYIRKVTPKEWAEGAAGFQIMLQPAAGKVESTGTAEFRKLEFRFLENAAELTGRNQTGELFFKFQNVSLTDNKLKSSPFARTADPMPKIEFVSSLECGFSQLQLIGKNLPDTGSFFIWNEAGCDFEKSPRKIHAKKLSGSAVYDLSSLPDCRRIRVVFPGRKSVTLDGIRVYTKDYPQENWNANWIWFGSRRVDNIDVWLRKEYNFKEKPARAILQCAVDDVGDVYVNGQKIGHFSGRANPPNYDISKHLITGKNVVAVKVHQFRYSAGFLGELDCRYADGREEKFITDKSWKYSRTLPPENWTRSDFDDRNWKNCVELAKPPQGEWGNINYRLNTSLTEIKMLNPGVFPAAANAGDTIKLQIQVQADAPIAETPFQIIMRKGKNIFQVWNAGKLPAGNAAVSIPIELKIPDYLISGQYLLEFKSAYSQIVSDSKPFTVKLQIANPRRAPLGKAKIEPYKGVPTIMVEGKPVLPMFSASRRCTLPRQITHHRIFNHSSWDLVHLYIHPEWNGDVPNFDFLDSTAAAMLEGNPQALAILKVNLRDSQGAFIAQYPEERVVFDNGSSRKNCSLASEKWRAYVSEYIKSLIDHISASPYADKIIGCVISEGEEGQWLHYWNSADPSVDGAFSDYSHPMLKYFRNYLRKKYGTNEKLQSAWNKKDVTFDNAAVPGHAARAANDCGFLRDPVKRADVIDYVEALSQVVVDGMAHYSKIIKQKTNGNWLTGALYGHIMDVGMYMLAEQGGGLAEGAALDIPSMDIYMGPLQYRKEFRDVGGVGSFDSPSPGSCQLHNKIWVNENDLRTHLTFPAGYAYSVRHTAQFDQVLAREVAKAICGRSGFYLLSMGLEDNHHWYDDPETIITLKELDKIIQDAAVKDRSSRSQIAVFGDDASLKYMRQLKHMQKFDSLMRYAIIQREAIARIGAAFDEYMQSDLINPKLPEYKFYIFLNPIHLTREEQMRLRELAKNPDIRILFLFTPGIAAQDGLKLDFANELTGMDFVLDKTVRESVIELFYPVKNLTVGKRYGWPGETFSPAPIPRKFDRKLAVYPGSKTPAAVTKGNIAYSTLGVMPTELLRMLALEAGVEIRSEDNIAVYECASYLAIHSSTDRKMCKVTAPRGRKLRMIWPHQDNKAEKEYSWQNTEPVSKIFIIE